jgi:hypothetical protein
MVTVHKRANSGGLAMITLVWRVYEATNSHRFSTASVLAFVRLVGEDEFIFPFLATQSKIRP